MHTWTAGAHGFNQADRHIARVNRAPAGRYHRAHPPHRPLAKLLAEPPGLPEPIAVAQQQGGAGEYDGFKAQGLNGAFHFALHPVVENGRLRIGAQCADNPDS
jgi:hypothetical protein